MIISDVGSDALLARLEQHWQSYENKTYDLEIAAETFTVLPRVYNPGAPIARTMANAVAVPAGARVLDLGCGAGVLGVLALKRGAGHVVFADLNPAAVENAAVNVERFGFKDRATVVQSDLFSAVGDGRFDVVIFNAPFLYSTKTLSPDNMGNESPLFKDGVPPVTSFFDAEYALLTRFFSEVCEHLDPAGFIQFSFSNLGNRQELDKILTKFRFSMELVRTETTGSYEWHANHVRPLP